MIDNQHQWQSFADLALGLLSVFVMILIMLLWTQSNQNKLLISDKELLKFQAQKLEEQIKINAEDKKFILQQKYDLEIITKKMSINESKFAIEIIDLINETWYITQAQDGAEDWLRTIFKEENCPLSLQNDGTLTLDIKSLQSSSLYESGQTRLSPQGTNAIFQCRNSLLRLADCLTPPNGQHTIPTEKSCLPPDIQTEPLALIQLREGLEAIILQGNTDMVPLRNGTPPLEVTSGGPNLYNEKALNFFKNAHLGSERARQALGHFLLQLQDYDGGTSDPLDIIMSRLTIESPSFGRYQVGPKSWRDGHCSDDTLACDQARNLSLKLRWKKQQLRKPHELIREKICTLLLEPNSSIHQGIQYAHLHNVLSTDQASLWNTSNHPTVTELYEHFSCSNFMNK
jgi:hypothetical protein